MLKAQTLYKQIAHIPLTQDDKTYDIEGNEGDERNENQAWCSVSNWSVQHRG